jgi:hypothetical protein
MSCKQATSKQGISPWSHMHVVFRACTTRMYSRSSGRQVGGMVCKVSTARAVVVAHPMAPASPLPYLSDRSPRYTQIVPFHGCKYSRNVCSFFRSGAFLDLHHPVIHGRLMKKRALARIEWQGAFDNRRKAEVQPQPTGVRGSLPQRWPAIC